MRRLVLMLIPFAVLACHKGSDHDSSPLPTVQGQAQEKIACYPMPGRNGPVKWLPVGQGNTCVIDCVCHYGCPRD